jgi:hypothetical protein
MIRSANSCNLRFQRMPCDNMAVLREKAKERKPIELRSLQAWQRETNHQQCGSFAAFEVKAQTWKHSGHKAQ